MFSEIEKRVREFWEKEGLTDKFVERETSCSILAIENIVLEKGNCHEDWRDSSIDWERTIEHAEKNFPDEIKNFKNLYDFEELIITTIDEASERALNSDTNTKALESDIYKELRNAYNALRNIRSFYQPNAEIVEQIDQLSLKIEAEMDELFSPIQLTISVDKLSTLGNKFANKISEIYRSAKSNYSGEIATALAELYDKEKQGIKLPKWEFVAKCIVDYLPQEYQRHESSNAPQAWRSLVQRHKRND